MVALGLLLLAGSVKSYAEREVNITFEEFWTKR